MQMQKVNTASAQKNTESSPKKSLQQLKTSKERRQYASELMERVKGHIPIVLEATKDLGMDPNESNKVVLVGSALKILNFIEFVRKKVKLDESSSLFIFAADKYLVKTSDLMGEVYAKYRNQDGFLYLKISQKQVWG